MTTYDPDLINRLVREAREDDERMEVKPWIVEDDELYSDSIKHGTIQLAGFTQYTDEGCQQGIARTRNNLAAMADQLEAAKAELVNATDCWHACEKDNVRLACELQDVYRERNTALAQLAQLQHVAAEIERQRHDTAKREIQLLMVVEAAAELVDNWRDVKADEIGSLALEAAIDAYRAAKGKT